MDATNWITDLFVALCDAISCFFDTSYGAFVGGMIILCGIFRLYKELTKI